MLQLAGHPATPQDEAIRDFKIKGVERIMSESFRDATGAIKGYAVAENDGKTGRGPTRRFEVFLPGMKPDQIRDLHHAWVRTLDPGSPIFGGVCIDGLLVLDENPLYPSAAGIEAVLGRFLEYVGATTVVAARLTEVANPAPQLTLGFEEGYGGTTVHTFDEFVGLVDELPAGLKPLDVLETVVTYGWYSGGWECRSEPGGLLKLRTGVNEAQAKQLADALGVPLVQTRVYTSGIDGETLVWQAVRD